VSLNKIIINTKTSLSKPILILQKPANYEFSYEVHDTPSGNDFGHKESRQGDVARGRYHVMLPDGRMQIVDYTADNDGYKPNIKYEGTVSGAGGYNYPAADGYKY
jgi:hypothetical protein